jgi:hypothetical protein
MSPASRCRAARLSLISVRQRWLVAAGAVLALLVAAALFSRYGIHGALARDEAVYAYGGQQLDDGVPFYASIFDQKTPGAAFLAGLGDALGGFDGIRIAFFVCACLTVVAVYLPALELWGSVLAALVAAVVFASFRGFAIDALAGPDAKTPGVLLAVVSMLLMLRRRWFWAGMCGALAFLFWQPLLIYLAVAVVASRSWRTVVGAAIPLVVAVAYFAVSGALGDFVQAAFAFPVEGLHRTPETIGQRLGHIAAVVHAHYDAALVWGGLALLVVLAALRRWWVVLASLGAIAAFSAFDFQGYPDVYPLLPYAALGIGGAVVQARRLRPVAVVAVVVLAAVSWTQFGGSDGIAPQRAEAAGIQRLLEPGETLYALGDPTPLVLTHRRNPSRYVFLGSGVGEWDEAHTRGGFAGWMASIRAADPAVIVLHDWRSALERRVATWLHAEYVPGYVGCWRVFMRPDVAVRSPDDARRCQSAGGQPPERSAHAGEQRLDGTDHGRA